MTPPPPDAEAPADATPARTAIDDETASRLRLALMRVARRLRQESPPGVTPSQLSALATIDGRGPLTIGELAAHENVQPPTISRIVGTLEGDGWVERIADANDRRVALVRSTPKAHRELARIRRERNAYLARRLSSLEPADLEAVLAALPALERLLQEEER
ncbi:MarR family winged helix-turn-helix transcriptional regulator [Rhabdothermincola salaria]|uniref:MarR family winged helix-turn-helix transcriptional regulator n=1 Tax=Rhabdothermincola salaria TaxID=2903142 RepID=UPI001E53FF8E|nr:MarR family transcriptional regulator [Rhabdothermincola salaria]MCD9625565.1 MarR family transcriptional regulator [Rhabdothermincola salaria]